MSDVDSPRTAIRKWLQGTEGKSTKPSEALSEPQKIKRNSRHHSKRQRRTRYDSETEGPHDEEAGRKRQRYDKDGNRKKKIPDKALSFTPLQAQSQEHSKAIAAVIPDRHGLAERLGLHAPFRTLRDRSDDSVPKVHIRPQKRRRCRSSTSSYLEPAVEESFSGNDHARSSHSTILRTVGTRPALGGENNNSPPPASKDSVILLPPPEELSISYRKRPRHKTRKDRYDLKESSRHGEKTKHDTKKNRKEKKPKKPKRREKSGAALMHGFTAQNVVHDRLTLKPAKTLGLFGKGKASSPVRRRGLPDLAFSEMTFLTSRREKPKGSFEDSPNKLRGTKKRQVSTKAADTEAEFSRYFLSTAPPSLDRTASRSQRDQQDRRQSQDHGSPQALVDLPERPFLGFGSCGPNTTISPAKSSDNTDSRSLGRRVSRSPTASTSYLTWSESRGASNASPPPDRRDHIESLKSSKLANRKYTSPAPHIAHQSIPPVSSAQEEKPSPGGQRTAFRPCSKHKTTNKAPRQNKKSPSAIAERSKSEANIQSRGDTGTVDLDAAEIPQNIDGSIPNVTDRSKTATHDCPESVSTTPKQATRQVSGREPRRKPLGHGLCHKSAQVQIKPPHRDQLDDILEALLKDCNTFVNRSDAASLATLSDPKSHAGEQTRLPAEILEDSRKPAHAFAKSTHTSEPPAPALVSSEDPYSAKPHLNPAIDHSIPTHTPFTNSLNVSSRPSLEYPQGYPPSRMHNEVSLMNAWNGYDIFYGRRQEPANGMQKTSIGRIRPNEAVQDDLMNPFEKSYHGVGPCEQIPDCHPDKLRDGFYDYRPHSFESSQGRSEHDNHQLDWRGEWYDQTVNDQTSNEIGRSFLDVSYEEFDDENMGLNYANEHQENMQSFAQRTEDAETDDQRFTTNVSDTYYSRRPYQHVSNKYGQKAPPNNDWVQDDGSAMSQFWTPHKLY